MHTTYLFVLLGLIAVQSDKLEVLKAHKKGLLQQLFASTESNQQH
jgi:hypothetical protein